MNREEKRMMARQQGGGASATEDADGVPAPRRPATDRPVRRPRSERTSPGQFLKEVRGELRRVAWPTRAEVVKYSTVVLITLILVTMMIFGLDYVFGKGVLFLFDA